MNLTALVRVHQVCPEDRSCIQETRYSEKYSQRGWFHYLRLGLLTVKWIDLATGQHVSKDEILQHLYPLWRTGFVVVLKRIKEVFAGAVPLT